MRSPLRPFHSEGLDAYSRLLEELHDIAVAAFTGYDVPAMVVSVAVMAMASVIAVVACLQPQDTGYTGGYTCEWF